MTALVVDPVSSEGKNLTPFGVTRCICTVESRLYLIVSVRLVLINNTPLVCTSRFIGRDGGRLC